jgi:hypothetical protein
MTDFIPKNRHLLVEPVDSEDTQALLVLPDDYMPVKEHEVVEVRSIAEDCTKFNKEHEQVKVLIPGNMLISFTYQGSTHYLVQENYVLAQIKV